MASPQSDGLDYLLFEIYKKQVLKHLRSKMPPELLSILTALKDLTLEQSQPLIDSQLSCPLPMNHETLLTQDPATRRSPLDKHSFIENSMKINWPICYRSGCCACALFLSLYCCSNSIPTFAVFIGSAAAAKTYGMVEQHAASLVSRQQDNEQQWAGHLSGFRIFVDHYPFVEICQLSSADVLAFHLFKI